MNTTFYTVLLVTFLITAGSCFAQQKTGNNSLKQSIAQIDAAFQKGGSEEFNKVVPLKGVQDFYAALLQKKFQKAAGKSKIIRNYKDSAYVLLSGVVLYGNSGDETNFSNNYTGIYKFEREAGFWKLTKRINIDRTNQIRKHRLNIAVIPGKSIKVTDTLLLDINDPFGFAVKLNHLARVEKLLLNGTKTGYTFSGGLLWINGQVKKNQKLLIAYTINVENDENDKNSGYFGNTFGHVRNQYFWHPFFSYSSPNDRADFSLQCTIPKSYYLSTSLPQQDSVAGDLRIIKAVSEQPTFGLSMYYDRDWEVSTFKKDQIDVVIYAVKDFLPQKNLVNAEFSKNYDTLQKHFGKPLSNYFGIVQDRSNGSGWKNRSNSVVVAGEKGGMLMTDKPNPRATFGHEVAHGWTNPTGPATNFLTEGWATYAESILLSSVYGDSIVSRFFNFQKQNYIIGKFDGSNSLWEDYSNSGVSYSKGSWLFFMLEHQLGKKNLSTAMEKFIHSGDQSIQSFTNEISNIAGTDMNPLLYCWLKSKEIPVLAIEQSSNQLKICQQNEVFIFPLEIRIKLKNGVTLIKVAAINSKEQSIKITEGEIDNYTVDPNHKILLTLSNQVP